MSKMLKIILIFLPIMVALSSENHHSISKRALLFPRATVLQFTYGVSAPLILPRRSINLSLCMQANYNLPYNLTLLRPKVIQAKSNEGFDLSRQVFYNYIVSFLDSFNLNGKECLSRLVCEISEYPMYRDHKENLLEEIVHFLFTPSLDATLNSTEEALFGDLLNAESIGRKDRGCSKKFNGCFVSLANLFTAKYIL